MSKAVLVTGASGGIGRALVHCLLRSNYIVIATDRGESLGDIKSEGLTDSLFYLKCDLGNLNRVAGDLGEFRDAVMRCLGNATLFAIVHNAACQIIKNFSALDYSDWMLTLNVNLLGPVSLSNAFLDQLRASKGSIVHIGSIHSQLTKSGFTAYATSKAALAGLTRAMAVELGGSVRVNAIEPAAISTPMLEAGFVDHPQLKAQLEAFHPTGSIGTPEDVARAVLFLLDPSNSFLNGCVLPLGGGIHSRLHDPA